MRGCAARACFLDSCLDGFGDADDDPTNGCECALSNGGTELTLARESAVALDLDAPRLPGDKRDQVEAIVVFESRAVGLGVLAGYASYLAGYKMISDSGASAGWTAGALGAGALTATGATWELLLARKRRMLKATTVETANAVLGDGG